MAYFKRNFNKYSNVKVERDGYSFASKLEAAVYGILKLRERAGELRVIRTQARVSLTDAGIVYMPDFECEDENGIFYCEAKGMETPEWRIKLKLWRFYGPGRLEIWKGSAAKPFLDEIVTPNSR